uniref:Uncharacterized protein n=1 Tax=virus sp. ctE0n6 TaxID=2827985 RepID=A0A8S5RFW9_9VIRU|nr:MAG TPA: hypothetical protein [virus sp. ctE0n6]
MMSLVMKFSPTSTKNPKCYRKCYRKNPYFKPLIVYFTNLKFTNNSKICTIYTLKTLINTRFISSNTSSNQISSIMIFNKSH